MSKTHIEGDRREPDTREFLSFCPPDIQPNTRTIALCGANDWNGSPTSRKDGWFFSDFYLFHHLLEGTGKQNDRHPCSFLYLMTNKTSRYPPDMAYMCGRQKHLSQDTSNLFMGAVAVIVGLSSTKLCWKELRRARIFG